MLQISEVVELLSVFTNDEIKDGLLQYHISGPRTAAGYLRKPAGGDLYQFIMSLRSKYILSKQAPREMPDAVTDTTPLGMKSINPERKESSERIMREVKEGMTKPIMKPLIEEIKDSGYGKVK